MSAHRSDRVRGVLGWLTRDRVDELTNPRVRLALPTDGLLARGPEIRLATGHPWRAVPCLVCGICPGDRPVKVVILVDPRSMSGGYYRVSSLAYLICSVHDVASDDHLIRAIHVLELPGCPCHSKAAAGTAADTRDHTEGSPA